MPIILSSCCLKPNIFGCQDDLEHFGDVASLEDNVESFLSHDDGDARDIFAALKRSPAEHNTDTSKGKYVFSNH